MKTTVNLNEELKKHFGFDTFKGDQEAMIRNLMEGTAIVISPLIALMKNQVDAVSCGVSR